MYPFLPPRRSPGLILSLDYSFQMHEKYNAISKKTAHKRKYEECKLGVHSFPLISDVSFLLLLPVGDLGVCPSSDLASPAWLHAWTGLTRRAPRVLLTDSELSQPPTSSGAGLAPAGV